MTKPYSGELPASASRLSGSLTAGKQCQVTQLLSSLCTIPQTAQVLDVLHRSGNVHDSHGAKDLILGCIAVVRAALPRVSIEVRMDSAFFSDEIVSSLDGAGVEYTVSVPFERFTDLKAA